jgi:hypothetical protein
MKLKQAEMERRLALLDPNARYAILTLYEMVAEMSDQLNTVADTLITIVGALENQGRVNEQVSMRLKKQRRDENVTVESIANDPEERKH